MTTENIISIQSSVSEVFKVFTDLKLLKEKVNGIKEIKILEGPEQMAIGTKWREFRVMFGKEATEDMWVTSLVPNASYTIEAFSFGTAYTSVYTFTEKDGSVTVHLSFKGEPKTFMAKLMSPLAMLTQGSVTKALQADLQNLKEYIEGM